MNDKHSMDEMELDSYINSMLDTERMNLSKDVRADKPKTGDDKKNEGN